MKTCIKPIISGLLLMVISSIIVHAQIPNAGFEQWTMGEPDGWATSNVPGFAVPVTQSSIAHLGASALRGEVVNSIQMTPYPPLVQSGPGGIGFPISQRYATLEGFYMLSPIGGDRIAVSVLFIKNGVGVAVGIWSDPTTISSYSQFVVPLTYQSSEVPDTAIINISIIGPVSGTDYHVGSVMFVDDLAFAGIVGVTHDTQEPLEFVLHQNYPNPFNPSTVVRFDVPGSSEGLLAEKFVSLKVYNMLGQEVESLVNEELKPGSYEVTWDAFGFPGGTYFYRLRAGDLVLTKKLVLLK